MRILITLAIIFILGWMATTTALDQIQNRVIKELATRQFYTREEAEKLNKEKGWTFETPWIRSK